MGATPPSLNLHVVVAAPILSVANAYSIKFKVKKTGPAKTGPAVPAAPALNQNKYEELYMYHNHNGHTYSSATPYQLYAYFVYPKRAFGKKNIIRRPFQQVLFKQWTWLHYDEANDLGYCHICVSTLKQNKMKESNAEPSFVSSGFSNWKHETVASKSISCLRACHHKAVDVIPATTRDINCRRYIARKRLLSEECFLRFSQAYNTWHGKAKL